jgi:hypothetical protein
VNFDFKDEDTLSEATLDEKIPHKYLAELIENLSGRDLHKFYQRKWWEAVLAKYTELPKDENVFVNMDSGEFQAINFTAPLEERIDFSGHSYYYFCHERSSA